MRRLWIFFLLTLPVIGKAAESELAIWYDKPAKAWTEALPLGNGRLGAMALKAHAEGAETLERLGVNFPNWMSGRLYAMAGKEDGLK